MALKAETIINAVNKGIALNPISFDVVQEDRVLIDGAYEIEERTITYEGLIYFDDGVSSLNVLAQAIGTEYTQNNWHVILNNKQEIKVNESNVIQFTVKEGTFIMKTANPVIIDGKLCCYLCDLQRID